MLLFRLFGYAILAWMLVTTLGYAQARSSAEKTDDTDCKIEDWRWTYHERVEAVRVEAAVTCSAGHVIIRAYTDKEGEAVYLGNMEAFIDGYAFTAIMRPIQEMELTRFRGYLILLGGGIHHATNTSRISA